MLGRACGSEMQEPGTDSGPRPIDAALGLVSSKVCPAKPRQSGCEPASQQLCVEWKLRLTFHSVLIRSAPRLGEPNILHFLTEVLLEMRTRAPENQ